MPSPDVEEYLGLELVVVDETDLLNTALDNLELTFPDWEPREGNTEVALLEQIATVAAEFGYAINRLPDGITEVLLRLFGLDRDPGAPPIIEVTFLLAHDLGQTVPAGTTVRIETGDEEEPVDFTTTADLVIAPGLSTGTTTAEGSEPTVAVNGIPAGTTVEVLDALTYVDGAVLATAANGGRLPEDGAAFLDRATPLLSRLTTTLVRPVDIEAYVAENADVTRVKVIDMYDPFTPPPDGEPGWTPTPGSAPGFITIAVAGPGGSAVPSTTKEFIAAQVRNRMHAGLRLHVIDATVTDIDVSVKVLRHVGYADADVQAAVAAVLNEYLNPDTWAWGNVVYLNELISRIDQAAGVDIVLEMVTPSADFPLVGYASLARVGAITVTVEAP